MELQDQHGEPVDTREGDGLLRDAGNALNRVVDAVGEKADLPPGQAREWAYYAMLKMINAAHGQKLWVFWHVCKY
eukprot:COSAG02_NODE_7314_length_3069_cov_2.031650_4_plen_75_part_00